MPADAPPLNPRLLLRKVLDAGAVLHQTGVDPLNFMVLASEHLLQDHRFVFHIAFGDYGERLHTIHFDGLLAPSPDRIEIIREGAMVATIQPVSAHGQEAELIWGTWQAFRQLHDVEYYEGITARLRDYDSENGGQH